MTSREREASDEPTMHLLVTAGPTREFFDSVRFISNPSSGKMGFAIAKEAAHRGHNVDLIAGPVDRTDPPGVRVTRVITAEEMFAASVALFDQCQCAVMTAAVCDYRPASPNPRKLAKSDRPFALQLVPTKDICAYLGAHKAGRVVVGFAMEDHDHHAHAEAKLRRKTCDAIVLNAPGNVAADSAEVEILDVDRGWLPLIRGSKQAVAASVVDLVENLLVRRASELK